MDAIVVGRETAARDDPRLTARPPGPRTAVRVVLDSQASLRSESRLVQTAREVPVLVAVAEAAPQAERKRLADAGCEVLTCPGADQLGRLEYLLDELGRRRMTNVLVEGGGQLMGSLLDARAVDEVHVFIAPELIGGKDARSPIAGCGVETIADALPLSDLHVEQTGPDVYLSGRIDWDR